jgi:hypothetical protein
MITILAGVLAILGTALLFFAFSRIRRSKYIAATVSVLLGLLLLTSASLVVILLVSIQGYHALTREETAATVRIVPAGPQKFLAIITCADGKEQRHVLNGDQFYIDAQVLKWKPLASMLGLHTAYELDRIAGRYLLLEDELNKPRTLHSLKGAKVLDLFTLRQRYAVLAPLVDAEYGSATFTGAAEGVYEVKVSTTGLLVRPRTVPQ